MKWLWLALALALACTGSELRPATQVLVVVESDLEVGAVLSSLRVSVRSEKGEPVSEPFPLALAKEQANGRFALPLSFGVFKQGADTVQVVVTGYGPLGPGGSEIELVEQRALVTFERERTLRMTVFLGAVCVADTCSGAQVCYPRAIDGIAAGGCGPVRRAETEIVQPGSELDDLDGGTAREAAVREDARASETPADAAPTSKGDASVEEPRDAGVVRDASPPDASARAMEDAGVPSGAPCGGGFVGTAPDCRLPARRLSSSDGSCVIRKDGAVWCWGLEGLTVPTRVPGLMDAVEVVTGGSHACARRAEGSVVCWGKNAQGQLGNGTLVDSATPVQVVALRDVRTLGARSQRTCAIDAGGKVWCWGPNSEKCLLGDCLPDYSSVPLQIMNVVDAVQVGLAAEHACALERDGSVKCWGSMVGGALGNGIDAWLGLAAPTTVRQLTGVTEIAIGGSYGCALRGASELVCWGLASYQWAQTTVRDIDTRALANVVTPAPLHHLVAGEAHQCALTPSGAVCRGNNASGQLGDDTFVFSLVAASAENTFKNVLDSSAFQEISAGARSTCALTTDERVWCWGADHPSGNEAAKPLEVTF